MKSVVGGVFSTAMIAVALVDRDPAIGTGRTTRALLAFGFGRRVSFTVLTQSSSRQRICANAEFDLQ